MQEDMDAVKPFLADEWRVGDVAYGATPHFLTPLGGAASPGAVEWNGYLRQKRQMVERVIGRLKQYRLLFGGRRCSKWWGFDFLAKCFLFGCNVRNLELDFAEE